MIKPTESLQTRRIKAVKVLSLVLLFVLVSFSPWSKKSPTPQLAELRLEVSR